jgi:hypothetical protein
MKKILSFIMVILMSSYAVAAEVETVVSDGYGLTIQSATQRAAEAALIQVVGGFMDSTTMVEKIEEIRDGIRVQTDKIDSKISEYSQGVIQSIKVLDVLDDGGLMRVTAEVSVRVEDFTSYIKETVFSVKKLDNAQVIGLISKIKVNKKQTKNLVELVVNKVLKDILSTQVIVQVIDGEIEEVTSLKMIEYMDKKVPGEGYVISVPVKATLNSSFIENALRILDETSEQKLESLSDLSNTELRASWYAVFLADFETNSLRSLNKSNGIQVPEDMLSYIFPERSTKDLCNATSGLVGWGNAGMDLNHHVPDIKMSFLSKTGSVLRNETIRIKRKYSHNPFKQASAFSEVFLDYDFSEVFRGYNGQRSRKSPQSSMLTTTFREDRGTIKCYMFIDTESEYRIVTKVTEDVFVNTDKIVLSYSRPKKGFIGGAPTWQHSF